MGAPRWAQAPDANQKEIVVALEKVGATVLDLHRVGQGCPDILVGWRGSCYLLELKTLKGKLEPSQIEFRDMWKGHFAVVRSPMEALKAIGAVSG